MSGVRQFREAVTAIVRSFSELLFLDGLLFGTVLFVVACVSPWVGLAGVIAVVSSYAVARLLRIDSAFLTSGMTTYNSLLLGMAVGAGYAPDRLSVSLAICGGVLALLLTVAVAHAFRHGPRVPVLTVPFSVGFALLSFATLRYSNLVPQTVTESPLAIWDGWWPDLAARYFESLGAILFAPHVLTGVIIAVGIGLRSRILLGLSVFGYLLGTSTRWLLFGSALVPVGGFADLNFPLVAMALGGVFLIPGPRAYLLAGMGVVLSAIVLDAMTVMLAHFGIAPAIWPFNLVTLGMLFTLGALNDSALVRYPGATPEETLEHAIASEGRFGNTDRTLLPPFFGRWTVWQGFNGPWTHRGPWRFALDFVISDASGNTHSGSGTELIDYYCHGKPVLSPIDGRVVKVVADRLDNPIGRVSESDHWGNLVVIEDPRGFHVELSHFAENSIRVTVGQWVDSTTVLGLCGNSGYSPQPHLHMQVQLSADPGAATVPFALRTVVRDGQFAPHLVPETEDCVSRIAECPQTDRALTFLFEDHVRFVREVRIGDGWVIDRRRDFTVEMAIDGSLSLGTDRSRLYFLKRDGMFRWTRLVGNDPILRMLYRCLPGIPIVDFHGPETESLIWTDTVPVGVIDSLPSRMWRRLLAGISRKLGRMTVVLTRDEPGRITSRRSTIQSDSPTAIIDWVPEGGRFEITEGSIRIRRLFGESDTDEPGFPNPFAEVPLRSDPSTSSMMEPTRIEGDSLPFGSRFSLPSDSAFSHVPCSSSSPPCIPE